MPQQVLQQSVGIVCPIPLGEYNPNTAYQKLNIVTYKKATFIAKVGSQGIAPYDENQEWATYWMLIAAGVSISEIGVKYQIGETGDTPPEGEWKDNVLPEKGKYLWTMVSVVYTDNTTAKFTYPVYEGKDAGFGDVTATAESVASTAPAEVSVKATGADDKKNITFHFLIPKGERGEKGDKGDGAVEFDDTPQLGSQKAVRSNGIYNAILAATPTSGEGIDVSDSKVVSILPATKNTFGGVRMWLEGDTLHIQTTK